MEPIHDCLDTNGLHVKWNGVNYNKHIKYWWYNICHLPNHALRLNRNCNRIIQIFQIFLVNI
jgi:hypothetical protein